MRKFDNNFIHVKMNKQAHIIIIIITDNFFIYKYRFYHLAFNSSPSYINFRGHEDFENVKENGELKSIKGNWAPSILMRTLSISFFFPHWSIFLSRDGLRILNQELTLKKIRVSRYSSIPFCGFSFWRRICEFQLGFICFVKTFWDVMVDQKRRENYRTLKERKFENLRCIFCDICSLSKTFHDTHNCWSICDYRDHLKTWHWTFVLFHAIEDDAWLSQSVL